MRERHAAKHAEASTPCSWMAFGEGGDDGPKSFYYDFATGESVDTLPDGAAQVPGVDGDLLPTYDVATLGMSPEMPGALAFQRPLVRPDLVRSSHLTSRLRDARATTALPHDAGSRQADQRSHWERSEPLLAAAGTPRRG